ncbi:liprin-beta-2 [Plakobranchus ocellatus]|uniref:Liprin-beta-2 n=1 Tax=Plakobranchus ocellatus TaxID=259542 RepID=A0AAV4CHX3_9GAST|nr:liprin-beta-2 [Plakobranchus ocellatus]
MSGLGEGRSTNSVSNASGGGGENFWYGLMTLQVRYDIRVDLDTEETFFTPVLDWDAEEEVNGHSFQSEERIRRLEDDKQSLALQVSVLSEQVDAQEEKIRDMEAIADDHKQRLRDANKVLQKVRALSSCLINLQ